MTTLTKDLKIKWDPEVPVSCLQFAKTDSDLLAVGSFNGSVAIYKIEKHQDNYAEIHVVYHSSHVLSLCFDGDTGLFTADSKGVIKYTSFKTMKTTIFGQHESGFGISRICISPSGRRLFTGGYDGFVLVWDINDRTVLAALNIGEKVFAMDCSKDFLVVGTGKQNLYTYNLNNLSEGPTIRKDVTRYQIRDLKILNDGSTIVIGTIEGRVAIEPLEDNEESKDKKYAFKCHRKKDKVKEFVYPVNAIAAHPHELAFSTGGSDKGVYTWNPVKRKRMSQFHDQPDSVQCLDYNQAGDLLAIGCTYLDELEDRSDEKCCAVIVKGIKHEDIVMK
uniref:Mitotic checkpoint protein BUB3 (inferred by orthology to a human protein) n=1 Tax=Strongyloides venezuelensis TaxID=75913 RepID=A0A0K0F339_STRVS